MALLETLDNTDYQQIVNWLGYDDIQENPAEILITRGLNKDYIWDINGKPDPSEDKEIDESSQGTKYYKELHAGKFPMSLIGKIHAITLESPTGCFALTNQDSDYNVFTYQKEFQKYSDLCDPEKLSSYGLTEKPNLEYYAEDFLYSSASGRPLNRMITLRRFPYACIDNISDISVQQERDVTRMITYFDDQTNKLEDILEFSYGLRWKELEAQMETSRMFGGDQEGLTKYMKMGALAFGDSELIKNRLRGPVGNEVNPMEDNNRVYGPVDSITSTHIRDVGFNFDKEFSLVFTYKSRSFGARNPDSVMKDILANILLCTHNDGDFWPGSRFWIGARPSKVTNSLKWMNSDDPNKILSGAWDSMLNLVQKKFRNKESALETLKNVIKGGLQMAMANILNTMGRPGIPFANSLLSNDPVGLWHLTIGHPMNPIMTMGDLICTGVSISFPDDTLSLGDFPTTIRATVNLKPAKPRDRAGIEMMFNHGKKRIYMPAVVKVQKNPQITSTKRGWWDEYVVKAIDKAGVAITTKGEGEKMEIINEPAELAFDKLDQLKYSVSAGIKFAQDKQNDTKVWINKDNANKKVGDAEEVKLIKPV